MSFHLSIFIFLAGAATACAAGLTLSVEGAADYALKQNPTLAAARWRIEEARGRLQQSGRLSNPELELEFTRHTTGREGAVGAALMQRFPLTARLRHEKAVSRAELAAAEAEVRDAERKLAAAVRATAVRLLALRAQAELREQQASNSRDLSGFLRKRVEIGEAPVTEAVLVELETQQVELENLQLATQEAALVGELRPLLGLAGEREVKITGVLLAPSAPPAARGVADRPDVQAAEARAAAAAAAARQQRASRWEDVGVGAAYAGERTKDEPDPTETEHILGLKLSIPLPVWNDNAGRIREAEAAAARATQEVAATKLTAGAEAVAARREMATLVKVLGDLDTAVLPKAAQIEEQLRINYSTGLTPLPEVLRARTRRLELQRLRLDTLRDYHLARVRYETALGQNTFTTKFSK